MVSSPIPPERQPPHRATLHCTSCERSSRINGDWLIEIHADHLDYECPECGTTIDSRRESSALATQSDGALRVGDSG